MRAINSFCWPLSVGAIFIVMCSFCASEPLSTFQSRKFFRVCGLISYMLTVHQQFDAEGEKLFNDLEVNLCPHENALCIFFRLLSEETSDLFLAIWSDGALSFVREVDKYVENHHEIVPFHNLLLDNGTHVIAALERHASGEIEVQLAKEIKLNGARVCVCDVCCLMNGARVCVMSVVSKLKVKEIRCTAARGRRGNRGFCGAIFECPLCWQPRVEESLFCCGSGFGADFCVR